MKFSLRPTVQFQRHFAKELGVTVKTIQNWELGRTHPDLRNTLKTNEAPVNPNETEDQLHHAFAYHPRLRKVKKFVDQHLEEPIGLQDAARVASLEAKYFSKLFKKTTGVTFSQWLHDQRIARAIELLNSEELSITSLATRVGYSDPKTFFRAFRARTGVSPSAFRESSRRSDNRRLRKN